MVRDAENRSVAARRLTWGATTLKTRIQWLMCIALVVGCGNATRDPVDSEAAPHDSDAEFGVAASPSQQMSGDEAVQWTDGGRLMSLNLCTCSFGEYDANEALLCDQLVRDAGVPVLNWECLAQRTWDIEPAIQDALRCIETSLAPEDWISPMACGDRLHNDLDMCLDCMDQVFAAVSHCIPSDGLGAFEALLPCTPTFEDHVNSIDW